MATHGLRGLTYRRVAHEAGTTHGLVSYHFRSREALIHEAAARASRVAVERSLLNPPSRRIEDFVRELPELVRDEADAQAFQFELALEGRRTPSISGLVRAAYEDWLSVTRESLRELGIAHFDEAASRLVFAVIDGLTLQQLLFEDPHKTREAIALLQTLLQLLARDEGATDSWLTDGRGDPRVSSPPASAL